MAHDPQQVAADWAARLAGSTDKITRGVAAVSVSPGQAASRQAGVWAANTAAAKDKFARNTAKVSLPDWQAAMTTKGVPRIASGAQASQAKMANFLAHFLPYVDNVKRGLPPRGNLEQNIARMTENARKLAAYNRTGQ